MGDCQRPLEMLVGCSPYIKENKYFHLQIKTPHLQKEKRIKKKQHKKKTPIFDMTKKK
jgi:hypothetical protein